ncbi:MAG: phage tail tape measure protein [Propionibacterium sp.]|nr:phage tail tape measure protein [Propionibacterium sp.]
MGLPPLWVTIGAKIGQFEAGMATADREIKKFNRTHETSMTKFQAGAKKAGIAAGIIGSAMVGAGYEAVKMAANFQTSQQRLTTTAGESAGGLKVVSAGVLDMAGKVGVSAQDLSAALYQVESGGFHGAKALDVLRAAAQGAKVEGSDTTSVAHALAGALNDYAGTNLTAVSATNAMTAAVGSGMMTFNDLAEALPHIGSRAAAAHVTFNELLSGVATMTKDGLPASVAATYLGQTIGQLAAPSAKARTEMKGLGINATELSQTLTSGSGHGLGDAIQMLYAGITKHLSPAGLVAVQTFAKSKGSASDYKKMLADLPPQMQTTVGALSVMSGGVKSMQGVLMLGGAHTKQYAETLKAVTAQTKKGGSSVEGFAEQQKTLNGKLADAKAGVGALMIKLGNDLLPTVTKIIGQMSQWVGVMERHKTEVEIVAGVLGGLVVAILVVNAALAVTAIVTNAAFLPVVGVIMIITALGLLIYELAKHWRTVWSTIKNATSEAWDWLKRVVSAGWNAVKGAFESFGHQVAEVARKVWSGIRDTTVKVWDAVAGFFKKWWPLLLAIFAPWLFLILAAWHKWHKSLQDSLAKAWGWIKRHLSEAWDWIKSLFHDYISVVSAVWQAIWGPLARTLSAQWTAISKAVSDGFNAVSRVLSPLASKVWGWIVGSFESSLQGVEDDLYLWYNIGSDIVTGLWNGISGGWSWLTGKVSGLASGLLGAAKKALGINSPSKLVADVIGKGIVEGIGKGITDNHHHAVNPLRNLTSALVGQPLPGMRAGVAGSGSAGGLVPGSTFDVRVPINLQIDGRTFISTIQTLSLQYQQRNGQPPFNLTGAR